jgi:predicted RNase H-like HicB family nuclease
VSRLAWGHRATEAEALENIRDAITEHLEAVTESVDEKLVRVVEIAV